MIIYLATHYTHPDAEVREQRFEEINEAAAVVMALGHTVFSPISHSHPIAKHMSDELLTEHYFWMGQDLPFLRMADELWIYPEAAMFGSEGVKAEIKEALSQGKRVLVFKTLAELARG